MLLNHAFGMFTHPDEEWESIRKEHSNPGRIYVAYIAVLAMISPICAYISTTQFGWQVGDGQITKLTTQSALQLNIITYIAMLIGVFGLGWAIDWMSKTYGGKHDEYAANGIALAAYSCTPLFLAGIALLNPEPIFNMAVYLIAAVYAGFLIYDGLPIVMGISKERALLFSGAILTVALVYLVATRVGTVVIWSIGFAPQFVSG
ncbi:MULTISPECIES: Yip1 family protein [unclassified Oleiphilus]|uniref:Yip1 family protein n=3 Tax=Oleiphilus TaxID=141450 RepID=UPI0007C39B10|nr:MULTISPECIES: Yip1 family protein [unclassified Oleiphilus]KZY45762.1 hypothetical protein A3732_09500 [Oleiphilus sp. HI0050]KZY74278.1 hypothetical protein A3740_02815 [Oleiphilus sp. HI0068]KZY85727.1 hypothetical protein A3741_14985 [Oleiphilus sp. HI0069]KZY95296.1 hypothetical protein A3743_05670 [Oleiphilus sp. HI0072]KZZ20563.1 hypothetical protein A3752_11405 [Oleiphilus sp. HI0081]KZZ20644.1 hypothetical protein A3749_03095 [Oleiphilus sp. HI0078]KZZ31153.1 hypothetical protein 